MRRLLALLGALALLLSACTPEQADVFALINNERQAHGLPELEWNEEAADKAQWWAQELARSNTLAHTNTGIDGVSWTSVGENVGRGADTAQIHGAFMTSPPHKANILGPWRYVGTGVIQGMTQVYVVQVFWV